MDRRNFLSMGLGSLLAYSLMPRWRAEAAEVALPRAAADAIIVLWMNGGPSHLDTWDPKPGTSVGGPTKAINTKIPGVQISANLPRLAEHSNHLAILRGITSREGNHDRARHLVHTGYAPTPTVAHPSLGAWVSEELGPASDLPAFVSIGGPSVSAGVLGVQYNPFVLKEAGKPPRDIKLPDKIDTDRFARRRSALDKLEAAFATETSDPKVTGRRAVYDHAVKLMNAPGLHAFTLEEEPMSVRQAYGDSDFGRGCLLARRLIENGVRVVEVALDGWDTNQNNFERTEDLCGKLDPAFSALLDDLSARKRLDRTMVICMGEFGRSPKINGNDGRDHHPGAWSAVMAGGGIRGCVVAGQTDAEGDKVLGNPIQVQDLMATFALQLGLDRDHQIVTPLGRPLSIVDAPGKVIRDILVT